MALQTDLELTYDDFKKLIGKFMGYGATPTGTQLTDVEEAINTGQRWVMAPNVVPVPPNNNKMTSHDWTFLRPVALLDLIKGQRAYALPVDFGNPDGDFRFDVDEQYFECVLASAREVERFWKNAVGQRAPTVCHVRPRSVVGGQIPTLWEVIFGPIPNKAYRMSYRYFAIPRKLSSTNIYAAGGAILSECYHFAMRAAADLLHNDIVGDNMRVFIGVLQAAVAQDRRREPGIIGYNGNSSALAHTFNHRRHTNSGATSDLVTVGGTLYD